MKSTDETKKSKEVIKGTGITFEWLTQTLSTDAGEYKKCMKRAVRLDAMDKGRLWEELRAKFPSYQLLPQTNHVSYIKNNILASIYTVGKSAQLLCTCEEDRGTIENLNVALDHIWSTRNVAHYQMLAGERAALLNLGITQVGWNNNIVTGSSKKDNFEKGQVILKNINPLKYYRDPYANDLDTASHVVIWDDYHESVIKSNPLYADKCKNKEIFENTKSGEYGVKPLSDTHSPLSQKGYHRIYTWFVRHDGKIAEIHIMDKDTVLYTKEAIEPNMFPFAELYCNIPTDGDLLGTSECAKIMDNSLVYNIMESLITTAVYKNQRPPRFVSNSSGINVNAFVKHGNDADKTFIVQGDASKAVHYHQYPEPSPVATQSMALLQNDVQFITGIDGRYTGKDTGSVITTGGVNAMLDQATLIDTTKIALYEDYARRLSKLIILNYVCNSAIKRKYLVKDSTRPNVWNTVEVDFPKIDSDIIFDYQIDISSEMPKNKARLAATADAMIEKQMQYQGAGVEVDLITPEEWLMMQDIPNKEYFQERMGIQKTQNWQSIVSQAVTQYAGLVDQGVLPADAINATAQTMAAQSKSTAAPNMEDIAMNTQMF